MAKNLAESRAEKEAYDPASLRPIEIRLLEALQKSRPALVESMKRSRILVKTLKKAHDELFIIDTQNRARIRTDLGIPPRTEKAREDYNLRMQGVAHTMLEREIQRWVNKVLGEYEFE